MNNIRDRCMRSDIHSESLRRNADAMGVSAEFVKIKGFFYEGILSF